MPPRVYWSPKLGHWFSLRPSDMADLNAGQLVACHKFISRAEKR